VLQRINGGVSNEETRRHTDRGVFSCSACIRGGRKDAEHKKTPTRCLFVIGVGRRQARGDTIISASSRSAFVGGWRKDDEHEETPTCLFVFGVGQISHVGKAPSTKRHNAGVFSCSEDPPSRVSSEGGVTPARRDTYAGVFLCSAVKETY